MTTQTKALLAGAAALAATKFYFKADWKTAAIAGGAVVVGFLVLTDFGSNA
jgi:hypothetical protein